MTDKLSPESMTQWQRAMARLDVARVELAHAEEVARLVNALIAARYNLTPADRVDSDGTIHRAPVKAPDAPVPGELVRVPGDDPKRLERFTLGARVWVYTVDLGEMFAALPERQPGTVKRLRTGDTGAWIALDERMDLAGVHPFEDELRKCWVKCYPDQCSEMAGDDPMLEVLDVEEIEP